MTGSFRSTSSGELRLSACIRPLTTSGAGIWWRSRIRRGLSSSFLGIFRRVSDEPHRPADLRSADGKPDMKYFTPLLLRAARVPRSIRHSPASNGNHVTFRRAIPSHYWKRRSDMVKWLLRKAIGKFERDWNYDASYMRDMIDASPRGAWLFSRVTALGQFRRDVPIDAWCAAGIAAVRHEDCGPCTQLGVTMAERAGASPAVLRAVLADNP